MVQVTLDEAQTILPDLLNAVIQGEKVFICKDETHVFQLISKPFQRPIPQFGNAKGRVEISDDFDEPLIDFEPYMR